MSSDSHHLHLATGYLHLATGYLHLATGYLHLATGYLHLATGYLHLATGYLHLATGYLHLATGYLHLATGYLHLATGYPTWLPQFDRVTIPNMVVPCHGYKFHKKYLLSVINNLLSDVQTVCYTLCMCSCVLHLVTITNNQTLHHYIASNV